MNIIPHRKWGIENPRKENIIPSFCINPLFTAVTTPRIIPRIRAKTAPKTTSSIVAGRYSSMRETTGLSNLIEVPKSPLKTEESHLRYCICRGSVKPSSLRISSISCCVAVGPTMSRAGSPGTMRNMTNAMTEIPNRESTIYPSRLTRYMVETIFAILCLTMS